MSMYDRAIEILKKINSLGYEAYIVGGYPRDKYLGINNDDIDICTNMNFENLEKYFKLSNKTNYGTCNIDSFEVTLFRKDYYDNSRYPKIELVETLKEDLMRRDFIINTLCIDSNGNYVDLMGAINDLDNKIINTIKNANISFKEDPIRIIRALRFSLDLNFKLDYDIINSINLNKNLLNRISKKRLNKEINKCKNKDLLLEMIK